MFLNIILSLKTFILVHIALSKRLFVGWDLYVVMMLPSRSILAGLERNHSLCPSFRSLKASRWPSVTRLQTPSGWKVPRASSSSTRRRVWRPGELSIRTCARASKGLSKLSSIHTAMLITCTELRYHRDESLREYSIQFNIFIVSKISDPEGQDYYDKNSN